MPSTSYIEGGRKKDGGESRDSSNGWRGALWEVGGSRMESSCLGARRKDCVALTRVTRGLSLAHSKEEICLMLAIRD